MPSPLGRADGNRSSACDGLYRAVDDKRDHAYVGCYQRQRLYKKYLSAANNGSSGDRCDQWSGDIR
jgi:hypothetical protein